MNGPHDLGGQQGFGRVVPERHEPAFHDAWERRAFALTLAMGATGAWNLDMSRAARESLPPAHYLSSSYYRIWFDALEQMLLARGLVGADELGDGRPRRAPVRVERTLAAADVAATLARGSPTGREATAPARYRAGDVVRTRLMNPVSHTRLPRYVRGRPGTIESAHGAHVYPDAHAQGLGAQPQWLYTVRFDARDLWGPDTTASSVCVDCWEPYLEPA